MMASSSSAQTSHSCSPGLAGLAQVEAAPEPAGATAVQVNEGAAR